MLKAIICDLDDTLYSETDYVRSGFKAVDMFVSSKYQCNGFFETAWNLFISKERNNIFNKALESLNINYTDKLIFKLVEIYRNHIPDISLASDIIQTLSELKKHFKLGIITDGDKNSQKSKIQALNLAEFMDVIIITDELDKNRTAWKPSPRAFEAMEENLSLRQSELLYVGDNLKKDFIAPNAKGWKTVYLKKENGIYADQSSSDYPKENAPQYEIKQFQELIQTTNTILNQEPNNKMSKS